MYGLRDPVFETLKCHMFFHNDVVGDNLSDSICPVPTVVSKEMTLTLI